MILLRTKALASLFLLFSLAVFPTTLTANTLTAELASIREMVRNDLDAYLKAMASKSTDSSNKDRPSAYPANPYSADRYMQSWSQIESFIEQGHSGQAKDLLLQLQMCEFYSPKTKEAIAAFSKVIDNLLKEQTDNFLDQASQIFEKSGTTLTQAQKSKDLDPYLKECVTLITQEWAGRENATQPVQQKLGNLCGFIRNWQLYLDYKNGGYTEKALQKIQMIQNDLQYPFVPNEALQSIVSGLKSATTKGNDTKNFRSSDLIALLKQISNWDDLVKKNGQIQEMFGSTTYPSDLSNSNIKLYLNFPASLTENPEKAKLYLHNNGYLNLQNTDPDLAYEVMRVHSIAFLECLKAVEPDLTKNCKPGDSPADLVSSAAASAAQNSNWQRFCDLMKIHLDMSGQNSPQSAKDSQEITKAGLLEKAHNAEVASLWQEAICNYSRASLISTTIIPQNFSVDRLNALRKDHPEEAKAAAVAMSNESTMRQMYSPFGRQPNQPAP